MKILAVLIVLLIIFIGSCEIEQTYLETNSKGFGGNTSHITTDQIPLDRTDLFTPEQTFIVTNNVDSTTYTYGAGWTSEHFQTTRILGTWYVVLTGYSNTSQIGNTFTAQFADLLSTRVEFINCARGSSALDNWVNNNILEGIANGTDSTCTIPNNNSVILFIHQATTQGQYDVITFDPILRGLLPILQEQSDTFFPNAIDAYTTGESAEWVADSKCPRICEPLRGAHQFVVANFVRDLQVQGKTDIELGPPLWTSSLYANSYGMQLECIDFAAPETCPLFANQHPGNNAREKLSQTIMDWMHEYHEDDLFDVVLGIF